MAKILLVEDEDNVRDILTLSIHSFGHEVTPCANPKDAEKALEKTQFEVVITDLRMDGYDAGLDVVRMSKRLQKNASVLLLTAYASAETAVEAMREGTFDYITKPVSRTELGDLIERALAATNKDAPPLNKQSIDKTSSVKFTGNSNLADNTKLIGNSHLIQRVRDRLFRAAKHDFTVLITGESGTGKELAARLVHDASPRASKAFVPVHCGAIPENLFESELFGYVKGAFTGADFNKIGLLESADGGTVFLDEIGEMPTHVQVKLLRVLQDMKVRPVGSATEKQINVRIIAATNRNLESEIKQSLFREDLFYRLNVVPVHMPALRHRREDIPEITHALLKRLGYANIKLTKACLEGLESLPLTGNVRELENTLQRMIAMSDDEILDDKLLEEIHTNNSSSSISLEHMHQENISLDTQLEQIEKDLIQQALVKSQNNATKAAKLLGIGFRSIRYRLEKLGIKVPKS